MQVAFPEQNMTAGCTHLDRIQGVAARTPACEECTKTGSGGA
jgi:hypothetical protein